MLKRISIILFLLCLGNSAMGSWFFLNKKYQDQITIRAYLMGKDQIQQLFSKNIEQAQLSWNELTVNNQNLAIVIRNNGDNVVWGKISCTIDGRDVGEINIPILQANMKRDAVFIVPVHGLIFQKTSKFPNILIKWTTLNVK